MVTEQLRDLIRRILKQADLIKYEDEREVELLMLTAATESNLGQYIRQKGGGPALGIFQMEPDTHDDIHSNFLTYREGLSEEILSWSSRRFDLDLHEELEWNLAYQILMCRIHYLRQPERIPKADDINGLANYWKKYFNSNLGKGTVTKAIEKYKKYCM